MLVKIDSTQYKVSWKKVHKGHGRNAKIDTVCIIDILDPEKEGKEKYKAISAAIARQNPRDHYDKVFGKRIALVRGLYEPIKFTRRVRKAFFEVFDKEFATK